MWQTKYELTAQFVIYHTYLEFSPISTFCHLGMTPLLYFLYIFILTKVPLSHNFFEMTWKSCVPSWSTNLPSKHIKKSGQVYRWFRELQLCLPFYPTKHVVRVVLQHVTSGRKNILCVPGAKQSTGIICACNGTTLPIW